MNEATPEEVHEALIALDRRPRVIAAAKFPNGLEGLQHPGLYSWWSDSAGTEALSDGLGHSIPPGRIYAGQAGAVAWPSGTIRASTLRSRISTNHLGGTIRGSTFRLTLSSILREPLSFELLGDRRMTRESEKAVSQWMRQHLSLAVHPFPDAARLADLEDRVLAELDPPLNLEGMPTTPIRAALRERRRQMRGAVETGNSAVKSGSVSSGDGSGSAAASGGVTLHDEIADILQTRGNAWTTTQDIADQVNARGRYHKRDGSAVTAFQVHGRTRNYSTMFERDGSKVRLREGT